MAIFLDSQKKPGERQEISRHDIVREELPGLRTFSDQETVGCKDCRRTELHRFTTFSYIDWLNLMNFAELYWPEVHDSDTYNAGTH